MPANQGLWVSQAIYLPAWPTSGILIILQNAIHKSLSVREKTLLIRQSSDVSSDKAAYLLKMLLQAFLGNALRCFIQLLSDFF